MSQLGIPKMRQTSHFLWHEPTAPAVGTYVSKARETATNPRSTGPREALCGLTPGWREAKHTRTDLTAVPHAGLGFQFLRVQVRRPRKEVEVHLAEVPKVAGGQQLQKKTPIERTTR